MRTRGCRLLQKYIEKKGTTHRAFAAASGISPTMLSHILYGRRRPTLDTAFQIQQATRNAVLAKTWRECEQEDVEPGTKTPSRAKA